MDGIADSGGLAEEAVQLAAGTDVTVLFLGLPEGAESEGYDRISLDLPTDQLELLDAVAAVARQLVVVLSNGGVVSVSPWHDKVDALLEGWVLGQEGGDAITDVLLGVRSPSGRLAETIPMSLQQVPSYLSFPGRDGVAVYGEGVFVGYRYFDTVEAPVAYPFGHGLTYSRFAYADLRIVSGAVENRVDRGVRRHECWHSRRSRGGTAVRVPEAPPEHPARFGASGVCQGRAGTG